MEFSSLSRFASNLENDSKIVFLCSTNQLLASSSSSLSSLLLTFNLVRFRMKAPKQNSI